VNLNKDRIKHKSWISQIMSFVQTLGRFFTKKKKIPKKKREKSDEEELFIPYIIIYFILFNFFACNGCWHVSLSLESQIPKIKDLEHEIKCIVSGSR